MVASRKLWLVGAALALSSAAVIAHSVTASHKVTMCVVAAAVLELNDANPVTLTVSVPAIGGTPPTGQKNETKRLWYSAVTKAGVSRKVSVSMTGSAPAGTSLNVEAISVEAGAGICVEGGVTISGIDHNIITLIPSCATGRLANSGAALRYSLNVVSPSSLVVGTRTTVTVSYTLTDDG